MKNLRVSCFLFLAALLFGQPRQKTSSPQSSGLNFAPAVTYSSGGLSGFAGPLPTSSLVLIDVNKDGALDLVVPNYQSNTVGVLLGKGDGTFLPAVTYDSGGTNVTSVAVEDVNADGVPDIVVANGENGNVGVLLGNGDGTFQPATTYGSGGYIAQAVSVGDLNGDGKPDLVVGNCSNGGSCGGNAKGVVGVLLGNGDGTFQPAAAYISGGSNATSVVIADVNADGKPDIIVGNGSDRNVSVLLGNGDGSFGTPVNYGSGGFQAYSVAVADVNGDGRPDVLVANLCVCSTSAGVIGVLLGNGDGTFQTVQTYDSGGNFAISLRVSDVNDDGKPDIIVANFCSDGNCAPSTAGTVDVLLGNGDGTFQSPLSYGTGGNYAIAVAVGDLNGDKKPDIAVANAQDVAMSGYGSIGVLINTTTFATTTALSSSPNPSTVGQTVTFTATVSSQSHSVNIAPTGTVSFLDSTNVIGVSSLTSDGVAMLAIANLAVGTHGITASYSGDSNFTGSVSAIVNQTVQGAIALLSTTNLTFGNQTVGIASTSQGVMLSNTGNIPLTVSISIVGINAIDFSQNNNCGSSVAAGSTCTINVTFAPTATGSRTAVVSIVDNAPNSPQSVSLSGTGVLPSVALSPPGLGFPTQVIFTASKAKTVTLTNTGLGILNIASIAVTGPFTQTNTCGSTVAPSGSCTFTVTFKPTTIGTLTGSISIADNAPGSPQKIGFKGTGTAVQLTPASINFGNQPVGTTSLRKRITLSNKSSVTVSIAGITITGADQADFAETNNCGTSVAAGASCFIGVTFTPSVKGARSAAVSVSDNGGGSPQQVKVAGTGK